MDADQRRTVVTKLRDNGFIAARDTTHGTLWRKGSRIILVGRSTRTSDPRAWRNQRAIIRRAGIDL